MAIEQKQEDWRQFAMNIGSLEPAHVEEIFGRHGAQAVTLTDAGDEPLLEPGPGETPLWSRTRISGLFPAGAELDLLQQEIASAFGRRALADVQIEDLADRDWEREWLKDFRPMRFGKKLWVCPGGLEVAEPNAVVVKLDPGLAFGTGTHATTSLCLEWLDGRDMKEKSVLDFGCGSGILSVAALLLGANSAMGVDIDPQAIVATQRNAERNGVAGQVTTTLEADTLCETYDLVVANILAGPLVENANRICAFLDTGGYLALSGILGTQAEGVRNAYRQWIHFAPPMVKDDWVLLYGTKI